MKVVYCAISSWAGRVSGAEHYYADLKQREWIDGRGKTTEEKVYHTLTQSEADRLNRRAIQDPEYPEPTMKTGEKVGYFFSRERAVEGAIAAYKELFPGAVILVEGTIGTLEPQTILDGPPQVMREINGLVAAAEEIDWWEEDEESMRAISDAWKAIWIPEFEEE